MRARVVPLLLVVLVAVSALAGCLDLFGGLSDDEARRIYRQAFGNVRSFQRFSRLGLDVEATAGGEEAFAYRFRVHPAEGAFLVDLDVSPRLVDDPRIEEEAGLLANLTIGRKGRLLVAPDADGNLTVRRDLVPDHPAFAGVDDVNRDVGGETSPDVGPAFGLLRLDEKGDELTVRSVEATRVEGRDAWRIAWTFDNATLAAEGTVDVARQPRLPLRFEATVEPKDPRGALHPLMHVQKARLVAGFAYDDAVEVTLPPARRAPVAVERDEQAGPRVISGTIAPGHDQEVPLQELELRLGPRREPFGPDDPPDPVHFAMRAAEGAKVNASFELHYRDADADGLLSSNDTYRAIVEAERHRGNVSLYWYDLWAERYAFQPGFEALLAVVAAGAAVAVLRRQE